MEYIYGPVPSRRLGISLGISPIPKKTCNYSCIYCQLGRTDRMTNTRKLFFQIKDIIREFDDFLKKDIEFDVVTIVGEGEPTLYKGLGKLIIEIKKRTKKAVAVITNGALLYDNDIILELNEADIVLPTLDAYDQDSFIRINRPHKSISYEMVIKGLEKFSKEYRGQLWIEIMLIQGINDDDNSLNKYKEMLSEIRYDRLYINTPVRPPTESEVKAIDNERMKLAVDILGGISIDLLESKGFYSEIADDLESIISIVKRHPMNQFEIESFLQSRNCTDIKNIIQSLRTDKRINVINYKGYDTFRLK